MSDGLAFAEGDELAQVKSLMAQMEPEIAKLREAGKDFPHTTGEIFFTRVLRANNGNMDESVKWYKTFLELRQKFGLDDIHKDCVEKNIEWVDKQMPGYEEVSKYFTCVFNEKELRAPNGHFLWYDAMGDTKAVDMLKEVGADKYVKFQHYAAERRTSLLDSVSREEGRVVKINRVMDFEGFSLFMWNADWDKLDKAMVQPVLMGTSCETVQRVFFINFPTFMVNMFEGFTPLIPPRLKVRFRLLDASYLQNKEFLSEVGVESVQKLITFSKVHAAGGAVDDPFAKEGGAIIQAGKAVERMVQVEAGQTVNYEYSIGKSSDASAGGGYLSRIAGTFAGSDVLFGAMAIWTDKTADEIVMVPAKVRSVGVDHGNKVEFYIDDKPVDYTPGDGVNIIGVDPSTKAVVYGKAFDMTKDPDAKNEEIVQCIKDLAFGTFVLVGVQGTGAEELSDDAWAAFQWCGSVIKGGGHWHKGYALVGIKGNTFCSEFRGDDVVAEQRLPVVVMMGALTDIQEVTMESGVQKGSLKVERTGTVVFTWSNRHSMMAAKKLESYKISVE